MLPLFSTLNGLFNDHAAKMRKVLRFASMIAPSIWSGLAIASQSSTESVIRDLMASMYSYRVKTFEYGRDSATNKYNPEANCTLLKSYFDPAMLSHPNGEDKCKLTHSRFAPGPDGTPMEEVVTADGADDLPPRPDIQSIRVAGNQAQVDIVFVDAHDKNTQKHAKDITRGRVIFFLDQKPEGWRIVNKLSFSQWPLQLGGENSDCRLAHSKFHFAIQPQNEAYLSVLPAACQKFGRTQIED